MIRFRCNWLVWENISDNIANFLVDTFWFHYCNRDRLSFGFHNRNRTNHDRNKLVHSSYMAEED